MCNIVFLESSFHLYRVMEETTETTEPEKTESTEPEKTKATEQETTETSKDEVNYSTA